LVALQKFEWSACSGGIAKRGFGMKKFLLGVAVAPLLLASHAQATTVITWSPSSISFGDVLVGATSAGTKIGVSRGTLTTGVTSATIGAASGEFSGVGATSASLGAKTLSSNFSFAPPSRGLATDSISVTGKNAAGAKVTTQSGSVVLSGVGVAPVQGVTTDAGALARFNAYGSAGANSTTAGVTGVTVKNSGNGDLAAASLGVARNLNGSFGSPAVGIFLGPVTGGGFSLTDGTTTDVTYSFNPTARGVATSTVTGSFSNGSSDGKNTAQTVTETLSGAGVGPTYSSAFGATQVAATANLAAANTNTPVANTGESTIDFGSIDSHQTETLYLDIGNTTTDANGGNALLTDLSLESASIIGSSFFTIPTVSTILDKGGEHFAAITFSTSGVSGAFSAVLTFQTDASAGFGLAGDTFSYGLVGTAVPEISTWAMMLAGFAGFGLSGLGRNMKARFLEA
jgi:hypothetical protein